MISTTPLNRREKIFFLLSGIFITNAILAEVLGGKLIEVGSFLVSVGVIPWPVVFIVTDLINEYYGPKGVRTVTLLTMGLIVYAFVVILAALHIPASPLSPVGDAAFTEVFGQSTLIIIGSVTAFAASQLVDVTVFWFFHRLTKGKYLWLRATGSTLVSQIIDTFIILGIAFYLPGKITLEKYLQLGFNNYTYKFLVAVGITPIIYLAHAAIDRYFVKDTKS
ncbi:MAG: hypothetical protein COT74_13735 [Bdellovibrionales bacterium CG10_big_fil_rev_8_21_14_0_10_45_34]|nr:MAG: hypothetical protein COT74_13735 [Bdellovibrionales bacterium CG10_big_fil_rev_8_21_14_0_10_45_34]